MINLVEMRHITKIYPNGVEANREVDFDVRRGEIHALVGENGAGKTTLMKILYGMEQPTEGQIFFNGREVQIANPHQAIELGIGMVHQHFMLVPSLTVAENIVLGREPLRRGMLDFDGTVRIVEELSKQYGLGVRPRASVEAIPVGMRQRVEVLKTLYRGADLLILDEPTSVLTPQEIKELFAAIHRLVEEGKTVIFISHKLREIMEISDRVTIMRDGRIVGTLPTAEATEKEMARMMVGREVFLVTDKPLVKRGRPILRIHDLHLVTESGREALRGVSLSVYAGEILGIAGVEGNGQTELVEALTGLSRSRFETCPYSGQILLEGQDILGHSPRQIREAGVAHIPEDRLTFGLATEATIEENLIVDRYYRAPFARYLALSVGQVAAKSQKLLQQYDIRAPNTKIAVQALSGGNMQKVVIAREFSAEPKLLIAAQPTRGIDVGATEFVREQLVKKRGERCGVLLISADLSEVMRLSDRIAVMYDGQIVAIFPDVARLTEEELGLYMLGLKRQDIEEMERYL